MHHVLLIFGRDKERCAFRLVKVGVSWKFEIILFHELVASGKKTLLVSDGLTPYFLKGRVHTRVYDVEVVYL